MATLVLVHGSWHDGSLWEPVARHLRDRGHEVHTPTIAGHGPDVPKNVDHDDCVRSIVDAIVDADLREVVLLGHSFGGTIIARVAEEIPGRLKRLIFWNAFVTQPGHCLVDDAPPNYREMFAKLAATTDDNTITLPFAVWREVFIQDADADLAAATYKRLSSEPYQPFLDKLDLTRFYESDIPKSYINATEDTALPPGEWDWHPRMSSRLGMYRLVQLPGSHEVMFTAPERLSDAIEAAARD